MIADVAMVLAEASLVVLPPVAPDWSAPGVTAMRSLIAGIMAVAFWCAVAGAAISLIVMAFGHFGGNDRLTSNGLKGLVISLIVAVLLSGLIPLFNWVMSRIVL